MHIFMMKKRGIVNDVYKKLKLCQSWGVVKEGWVKFGEGRNKAVTY